VQFNSPVFPTALHSKVAEVIMEYFLQITTTDTVLVVNSCAHGHAVEESDLDIAVLARGNITADELSEVNNKWIEFCARHPTILQYKNSNRFRHLHLDIINGDYKPGIIEPGEPVDFFEVEIGNQVCYAAPLGVPGKHFKKLLTKWLPYYDEALRIERINTVTNACAYDLDHISFYYKRGLCFHALYILHKALYEYLQALFITNKFYPLAYNKWIKYQLVDILNMPDLYQQLVQIVSVKNIESNEMIAKSRLLYGMLELINKNDS
jgi:hypothetical protein